MEYAKIIDISTYQDLPTTKEVIDFFKARLQGVHGVIIKASQGLSTDQDFQVSRRNAKAAGLPRGYYHFLTFTVSGKSQAQYFWNLVKDDPCELLLAVDFEATSGNPVPSNAKDYLKDFLLELERLSGITAFIYTGAFFWAQHGDQNKFWGKYPLWVASYTGQAYMEENIKKLMTPWKTWVIWQYTDKGDGKAHGMESQGLDLNYFNGTVDDFNRYFHLAQREEDCALALANYIAEQIGMIKADLEKVRASLDTTLRSSQELLEKLK